MVDALAQHLILCDPVPLLKLSFSTALAFKTTISRVFKLHVLFSDGGTDVSSPSPEELTTGLRFLIKDRQDPNRCILFLLFGRRPTFLLDRPNLERVLHPRDIRILPLGDLVRGDDQRRMLNRFRPTCQLEVICYFGFSGSSPQVTLPSWNMGSELRQLVVAVERCPPTGHVDVAAIGIAMVVLENDCIGGFVEVNSTAVLDVVLHSESVKRIQLVGTGSKSTSEVVTGVRVERRFEKLVYKVPGHQTSKKDCKLGGQTQSLLTYFCVPVESLCASSECGVVLGREVLLVHDEVLIGFSGCHGAG